MAKKILKIAFILILGMAGGFIAAFIFLRQELSKQSNLSSSSLSVNEKKEIIVEENNALQEAARKIEKSVVGIKITTKEGKTTFGSGLVVTSDGLIITLAELLPKAGNFVFLVDGQTPGWQILKKDLNSNLALVKLDQQNLSTVGFADFQGLKLGQRVFLAGMIFQQDQPLEMVNEGIIKFFSPDYIRTNIFEKTTLKGSPLFNIKGELLGLNTIDSEGKVTAIPIDKIREFIGF